MPRIPVRRRIGRVLGSTASRVAAFILASPGSRVTRGRIALLTLGVYAALC